MKILCLSLLISTTLLAHAQITPELWGTASLGGANGIGTIMKINGDGTGFQRVFSFTNGSQQSTLLPTGGPLLYGNTVSGGVGSALGSIFSYNSSNGDFEVLFSFDTASGYYPRTTPILASNGKLYGNTNNGGAYDDGTLFSFDLSNNTFEKLHDFNDTVSGKFPVGDLFQASNGKLFGMTSGGNSIGGGGLIYSYDVAGNAFTVEHEFQFSEGFTPLGGGFIEYGNALYGMAFGGGANGNGTIFRFNLLNSAYSVVHNFNGTEGSAPVSTLIKSTNDLFYGMTSQGGDDNDGVLFSFDPADNFFTVLHDFEDSTGNQPNGSLMQASDGNLYGMTQHGGANDLGAIFSYNLTTNTYTKLHDCNFTDGAMPYGNLIEYTAVTGIANAEQPDFATIFPNPSAGEIQVRLADAAGTAHLQVFNAMGKQLQNSSFNQPAHAVKLSYPAGIYFITITCAEKRMTKKIVIE